MGKCERIKNIVFFKVYSLLIYLVIYIFVVILFFGLGDEYLIVEIMVVFGIFIIFIVIEKIFILM